VIKRIVICRICLMECNGEEANEHKILTGHNSWNLIIDPENTHRTILSYLGNEQGMALDE